MQINCIIKPEVVGWFPVRQQELGHWDRAGMSASLLCALHCAAMPLLVGVLPAVVQAEWLEWALVGSSAVIGVTALRRGYPYHRHPLPTAVLGSGLLCLVVGRLREGHEGGLLLVVLGGLLVAVAHFLNHRLTCQARLPVS